MKKFLSLLFALLMPFCFLFGCAGNDNKNTESAETSDRYSEGYSAGFSDGLSVGKENGYAEGYKKGTEDGKPNLSKYPNCAWPDFYYDYTIIYTQESSDYMATVFFEFVFTEDQYNQLISAMFYDYNKGFNKELVFYSYESEISFDFKANQIYTYILNLPKFANTPTIYSLDFATYSDYR